MFNYSSNFTLSPSAVRREEGGGAMACAASARRAGGKRGIRDCVRPFQQTFSCSSFDCQWQMKSDTFREGIRDEAALAKHLAATRLRARADRKVSGFAPRFSRVNVL